MDFIVQLLPSESFTVILMVVNHLTKMAHFTPTTSKVDAAGTVSLFLSHIVAAHGIPDDIVSDQGSTFVTHFMKLFLMALGTKQKLSTAYHQQTNGQMERMNATLKQYLQCFLTYQQDNWVSLLPLAKFSYNNMVHSLTGMTPFFALHGYHLQFSIQIP